MRLVVIGGGIAGLAGAYEATRRGADVALLEASERIGGEVWTERVDGVPLEWGPDSFVASKPAARELAQELGLELVEPEPTARRAYLLRGGDLHPFPIGLAMGVPRGPVAAIRARRVAGIASAVRALAEPFIPGPIDDRPVAQVMERRLGRSWARRLVVPLVEGVYGARAEELGMHAALPQFAGARSLIGAARRQAVPTRSAFLSIRGGMGRLVERMTQELELADIRLRCSALAVERRADGFVVRTSGEEVEADRVLVAVPAPLASPILHEVSQAAVDDLATIRFGSSAVVHLRYRPGAIGRPPDGAGYLVPREEGLAHAACTWTSAKWGYAGDSWLRAVVTSRHALDWTDEEVEQRVHAEVARVMLISGPAVETRLHRWERALPVYSPGHLVTVDRVERALPREIAVAGASYRGLGVPDCIASGRAAAARLLEERGP